MTLDLNPELKTLLEERSSQLGTSPEEFVLETLRRTLTAPTPTPQEDWEALLMSVGSPAGVSFPDEATSRDSLYD